jgi:hypothetical protein
VRKFVLIMLAAVCLTACGASAPIAGSTVKRVTSAAGPDSVEVVDTAKRSTDAAAASHPVAPVSHPTERLPVTRASRPAAPPPLADPDRVTPGFDCQGFSGPGKPKLMCALP